MRYTVSAGKLSEITFSKVLSLPLHHSLAPVLLVQEGIKAKGLLPAGLLGCQSPHVVRVGAGLVHVWAATGDGTAAFPPLQALHLQAAPTPSQPFTVSLSA